MSIALTCQCGKSLRVKDDLAGKRAKCPACGQTIVIPPVGTLADPNAGTKTVPTAPAAGAATPGRTSVSESIPAPATPHLATKTPTTFGLVWAVACFVAIAIVPVTVPLMFALGCPTYGHVIPLYFLMGSVPSFCLAVVEAFVNRDQLEKWGEMLGNIGHGGVSDGAAVKDFRPHRWGKWFAGALALAGFLATVAIVVMYPEGFMSFLATSTAGHRGRELIVDLLVVVLGGPGIGAGLGYAYGIHLGALVDCVIWLGNRGRGTGS